MEESHIFSQKRYRERPTSFSNVFGVCREDQIGLLTVPQALGRNPAGSAYCGVLLRLVFQERREHDLVALDVVLGDQLLPLPDPPTLLRLLTLGLHLLFRVPCVAQHFRGFATLPLVRLILHRLVCRSGLRCRAGVRSFAVVRGTPGRPAAVRFRPASVQNAILS